jgi:two-component system response regulator AtoC
VSAAEPVPPLQTGEPLVSLAELERRYIQQVLDRVGGNKSRAARILGVDRRTLYSS